MYVTRLQIENARQHVFAGNYKRANFLIKFSLSNDFRFRKFVWGTAINHLARFSWKLIASLRQ